MISGQWTCRNNGDAEKFQKFRKKFELTRNNFDRIYKSRRAKVVRIGPVAARPLTRDHPVLGIEY